MSDPVLSKRARSQRALDLVHGRKGGRNLPRLSDYDQDRALKAAVAAGSVVRAHCGCMSWWLARRDVGTRCRACDEPMVAERRFTLLDPLDAQ